jgi:quinol monooxygenase YgiN
MMVRIVRMAFRPEEVENFIEIFSSKEETIKKMPGCSYLELMRDKNESNVFYTVSHWNAESDLNNYRNSEFFKETWSKTKALFSEKPQAYSMEKYLS